MAIQKNAGSSLPGYSMRAGIPRACMVVLLALSMSRSVVVYFDVVQDYCLIVKVE